MTWFRIKKLDLYISKKFIGTYFFAIALIISIAVIFDLSEKLDDFMEKEAPTRAVIFDYYMNFIPYFANLFSALFTFIAVIFFTSKMAANTEIIAILASGVSFRRMMLPYFGSALIIFAFTFMLTGYIIPPANKVRLEFEAMYLKKPKQSSDKNIHKQIRPGEYVYLSSFNSRSFTGYNFSLEKFEDGKLQEKWIAEYVKYDTSKSVWGINNYYVRKFDGIDEHLEFGQRLDTVLNMKPEDFNKNIKVIEAMNNKELDYFIKQQKLQGSDYIEEILVERYNRLAIPFSTFILSLIGVSISSRKIRGGVGLHIGIGIFLSFTYILFQQFSAALAVSGNTPPMLAVWIPNIIYLIIGIILYRTTPK